MDAITGLKSRLDRVYRGYPAWAFLGSKAFVDRIKSKYLSDEQANDMPQKVELLKAGDPREIIAEIAKVIGCDK